MSSSAWLINDLFLVFRDNQIKESIDGKYKINKYIQYQNKDPIELKLRILVAYRFANIERLTNHGMNIEQGWFLIDWMDDKVYTEGDKGGSAPPPVNNSELSHFSNL